MVRNLFTVDVEDWYHLKIDARHTWDRHERLVHVGVERILALLARHRVRATFFVLSYVAETTPEVIREIVAAGHEIASHGFSHQLVYHQTEEQFEEDLKRSVGSLSELAGRPVTGYRASSFSVSEDTPWFWDVLERNGILWDSSTFPVKNPFYGGLKVPMGPHRRPDHDIIEIPVTPIRMLGLHVPFSGGFYFRLHHLGFIRWAQRRVNRSGRPVIFYVHPWEYIPEQPRMDLAPHWRFFRYHRLGAMAAITDALLGRGEFETMGELAGRLRASEAAAAVYRKSAFTPDQVADSTGVGSNAES